MGQENKEESKGQEKKEEEKKEAKEEGEMTEIFQENKEENKGQEKKEEEKKEAEEEEITKIVQENKEKSNEQEKKEEREEEKKEEDWEEVPAYTKAGRVVVTGNALDPVKLRDELQSKLKTRVELISPLPKPPEEKKEEKKEQTEEKNEEYHTEENKEQEKKEEEERKKKEEEPTDIVLGMHLHCDGCVRKIRRSICKIEGVERVKTEMPTVNAGEGLQKRRGRRVATISRSPEPPEEKKIERQEQKEAKKEEYHENNRDIEANRGNTPDGWQNYRKVSLWDWIFVVSNLTLELPSAVFDQLSSAHKPLYALMAMTLSLLAFVLCVIELLRKGVKEGITFKCPKGTIPWFYYSSRSQDHKRFGTFADIIGLVFAISQCIVTAINYDFARRAANSPIKFSLLPIIFALGLLCSRILKTLEKEASERQGR